MFSRSPVPSRATTPASPASSPDRLATSSSPNRSSPAPTQAPGSPPRMSPRHGLSLRRYFSSFGQSPIHPLPVEQAPSRLRLTDLPAELLLDIYQRVIDLARDPGSGSEKLVSTWGFETQAQLNEQAAMARTHARLGAVTRHFAALHHMFRRQPENADVNCLATQYAIEDCVNNMVGSPHKVSQLKKHIQTLLANTTYVGVDMTPMDTQEASAVLDALIEMVQTSEHRFHTLRFRVDLDQAPEMLAQVSHAIDTMRAARCGADTTFELACSSSDPDRTDLADLPAMANVTVLNLTGCGIRAASGLEAAPRLKALLLRNCTHLSQTPDLSGNGALITLELSGCPLLSAPPSLSRNGSLQTVRLAGCSGMRVTPVFTGNPHLTTIDLHHCSGIKDAPDLSANLMLKKLNMVGCLGLTALPDLSRNRLLKQARFDYCPQLLEPPRLSHHGHLRVLSLYGCHGLGTAPDLSALTGLEELNIGDCRALPAAPDFSANAQLKRVILSDLPLLTQAPSFASNPALTQVDFSRCPALVTLPDFTCNLRLHQVRVARCPGLIAIIGKLRDQLGSKLAFYEVSI